MKKPKIYVIIAFLFILLTAATLWFFFRKGERDNPIEEYRESSSAITLSVPNKSA